MANASFIDALPGCVVGFQNVEVNRHGSSVQRAGSSRKNVAILQFFRIFSEGRNG
jgi:hypothetical protein